MTTLFSVLLLLLWVYVSTCRTGTNWQNLYANRIRALLFRPISAAERALPRDAPEWVAPAVCGVLLLAARALLGATGGGGIVTAADMRLCGGAIILSARGGAAGLLALQLGAFALLLANLALLRLLLVWRIGETGGGAYGGDGAPVEFLGIATWPATRPGAGAGRNAAGAAALLIAGAALCCAGVGAGLAVGPMAKLAIGAAIDTLALVRSLLFAFCILSFASAFSGPAAWGGGRGDWLSFASMAASDWLDSFERATFGHQLVFGAIGIGPLILFFATGLLHKILVSALI